MIPQLFELQCMHCRHSRRMDAAGRLRWLQLAGHLRKVHDPHSPLIEPLVPLQLAKECCSECGQQRMRMLLISLHQTQNQASEDDMEWGSRRLCQDCRQPIAAERLAALPEATRCIACQSTSVCAAAVDTLSDENCPKCGAWLHWETLRTSIGTFRLVCRQCGPVA